MRQNCQSQDSQTGYRPIPRKRSIIGAAERAPVRRFSSIRKLAEAGVEKVVPDADIIEQHTRPLVEQTLTEEALDKIRDRLAEQAAAHSLPGDPRSPDSSAAEGAAGIVLGYGTGKRTESTVTAV